MRHWTMQPHENPHQCQVLSEARWSEKGPGLLLTLWTSSGGQGTASSLAPGEEQEGRQGEEHEGRHA